MIMPNQFGQSAPNPNEVRRLATLATGQGGLGIPDLRSEAPQRFAASRLITTAHVESIASQSSIMVPGKRSTEELKRHQQSLKRASTKAKIDSIDSSLSPGLLRLVNQSRDKGVSSWLNAMPLADQGLALNKKEFRDSLRLRYHLPLVDLPSHCACGDKFTVCHVFSCKKKGGVVAQTHDGVRNLLTTFIDKICNNIKIEPRHQPLENERFYLRSAVTSSEARQGWTSNRGVLGKSSYGIFWYQSYARQLQVLPEQDNIGSVQGARRREEAQVPVASVRCRNGFVYTFSVWNQWWNGKRVSAVLKTPRRQNSPERYRALSYSNRLARDTDFF